MIGPQILRQMSEIYRKLRGTLRYLLANLHDWKVNSNSVAEVKYIFPLPGITAYFKLFDKIGSKNSQKKKNH